MIRRNFIPTIEQGPMLEFLEQHERCALFADMGLGKTVTTLTVLDALQLIESGPSLVLGPLRVARDVWPYEVRKWKHLACLDVSPIIGSEDERIAALKVDAPVHSMNYDNLPWLVEHLGDRWPFATVVGDESTRLKSFRLRQGGKRSGALARVAWTRVKRWINLTGTPCPNGLADLWGQTWFLDRGARLGLTYDAFRRRWFQKSFDGYSVEPLPYAQEQIQGQLRDICLTVTPAERAEPIALTIFVELPAKARAKYKQMEREMFAEIAGHDIEAFNAAGRTNKCLQLANGAAYIATGSEQWTPVHDAKLEALDSLINELGGKPLIVVYNFKSDVARILKAFPKARLLKTKTDEDDWNKRRIPILVLHPKSAGHGLNLQDGGHHIVFFGHDWNLEDYMQAIERIGPTRQKTAGYDRPVFVYHIVARDTVDEIVMARRASKRGVQDLLLEHMRRKT